MLILRSLWEGFGYSIVQPIVVFGTLRVLMFTLSFVLEDWALYELIDNREQRRLAILLVASSYVTWTWQVHTFSNAIETLVVTWSLVLMKRVAHVKVRTIEPASKAFLLMISGSSIRSTCIGNTGLSTGFRHIQSYHFPSIYRNTCFADVAKYKAQVNSSFISQFTLIDINKAACLGYVDNRWRTYYFIRRCLRYSLLPQWP